jgi:EAL domain-containing protein (putative c-di-GMP-specific phosphodiesterase class I)/AmiR/NasT family two-component response regulator
MTSGSPDDFSRVRVLVVEDQSHVRSWVRTVLRTMGMNDIVETASGREALVAVMQPGAHFDLILCDLRMPDQDGIETIRTLAALGVDSAIVITSIEEERVLETAGMLAELQGLRLLGTIPKPLTAEKLEPLLVQMRQLKDVRKVSAVIAPEQDLKRAFERREFMFCYQPKVSLQTGKFAGAEALVRWQHPDLGLLQPAAFMGLIEQSDEYSASLVNLAATEAVACASRWHGAGRELDVAINVSARAFDDLRFPERMETICRDQHLPTERVTFEVTETQVARDPIRMADVATRLRLKGFALSIDDFGTGQSGLANLQKLPFNEIKIDRQFVHGCVTSATQRSVVEASLALARSLKMTAVAEGVETRADWDLLGTLGCDVMQGYFIARPMTENGLEAWAAQWVARAQ